MKRFLIISCTILVTAMFSLPAQAIKKCKDASGHWHYGDNAAIACSKSTVIEINDRGLKKGEVAPPPTRAQLKNRATADAEKQRLAKLAAKQKRRDKLLLTSYGHEKDITYVRDRKLASIDAIIKASVSTKDSFGIILKRLEAQAADEQRKGRSVPKKIAANIAQTKEQIIEHEKTIVATRKEREQVIKQYESDIKRYRELKGKKSVAKTP
jgi:tRNA/tmRNA/rRNA uracil-C5-methylase (TrmA/RlmC/RlmD family)